MNRKYLESALVNSPETTKKVSAELHQNVMRAVRLAQPVSRKRSIGLSVPAWAATALAVIVVAVIFYPAQTERVSPFLKTPVIQSQAPAAADSLMGLGKGLLALSEETPAPETELRKEIERLKSDLARFDFRS